MKKTNILVFDGKTENLVAMLSNKDNDQCPFFDAEVHEQLNKDFTFEFSVPADHEDSKLLIEGNLVGFYDLDGDLQIFQIYKTEETHNGDSLEKRIFTEHLFYELLDDIVEDLRVIDGTALDSMTKALSSSRWKVGIVDELGLGTINFYYSNGLENIQNVANVFKGELHFRFILNGNQISKRLVDLRTRLGSDTGKRFEFNKDMVEVKRTVQMDGLKTALYGRGKGEETEDNGYTRKVTFKDVVWRVIDGKPVDKPSGQEWVGLPEALSKYGRANGTRHRFGVFEVDSTDPEEILNQTFQELQRVSQPLVTYEMNVISLEQFTGYEHEKVRKGDTVFVIDRELGLEIEARVVDIKRDPENPDNTEVILGNFIDDITDYNKKIEQIEATITDRKGVWDKVEDVQVGDIDDSNIVNVTPSVPTNVNAKGLFKSILVAWNFDPSIRIASYELYGSRVQGFTPDQTNLLFKGKSGGHIVESETNTTWYFRVRAINPHGVASAFTQEFSASTIKVDTPDFEELSIVDALIHSVSADKLTAGTIDANIIDVINLNASKISSGILDAKYVRIGATTTYEAGYDPSTKATPTQVAQAETNAKSYADTKKQEAIDAANAYATQKAEYERTLAEAYADGIVDAEEQARINDVQAKLNESKLYADQKKAEAISAASTDATNKANTAEANAKNYSKPVMKEFYDAGFVNGKDFWSESYNGQEVASTTKGTINTSTEALEGGKVWSLQGQQWLYSKNAIPVNVNRVYKVTFRVRQTVDPTTSGTSKVYAGVTTLDSNFNNLTGGAGTHRYCAASGVNITVADGWQEFEGLITGVGDTHDKFRAGTIYVRPMFIVNYSGGNGTVEVDFVKFEDVTEMNQLQATVYDIDLRTTETSIISTVRSSQSYQNDLLAKADASTLGNYASKDDLSQAKSDMEAYADNKVAGIDLSSYATTSYVDQKANEIDFKFSSSGGVNLLKNSVGFAGADFWAVTLDRNTSNVVIGSVDTIQNAELTEKGVGSGFVLKGAKLVQTIVNAPQFHTISTLVKKGTTGTGYLKVTYTDKNGVSKTSTTNFVSGTAYDYKLVEMIVETGGNTITVELYGDVNSGIIFTGTMVNVGNVALQWQHSAGEVYNTNVLMDLNGIRVNSSSYNGYTAITPQEFSGYAEVPDANNNLVMTKVFTLNKDVTEVSKINVDKEITMSPIKVVPVQSASYNGWAFIAE
jgi:phage minor structural protein